MMGWDAGTWLGAVFTLVVVPACFWAVIKMDRMDDDDSGMS